ncbi:hypothetical protein Poly24_01000 [Rosistilla carotiformis]|uniref:Uncharacterized protein n=1 Tax=Rosistilla carotiformis TaxID=2528017 RepID=A0A518JLK7_9BACT|nr:hypothetical protein [Rosistilla carotiformis]QDV66414.1 hypothetical protein Poly24_01000 [Rosistilla carotiformis]
MMMRLLLAATICLSFAATAPAEPAGAETKEVVKYQLLEWKNKHTRNNDDAEKLIKAFKTLKVEMEVSDHGNHKDVKYRCPKWKQLTVKDHDTAHQWEAWLKKLGFKTIHEH